MFRLLQLYLRKCQKCIYHCSYIHFHHRTGILYQLRFRKFRCSRRLLRSFFQHSLGCRQLRRSRFCKLFLLRRFALRKVKNRLYQSTMLRQCNNRPNRCCICFGQLCKKLLGPCILCQGMCHKCPCKYQQHTARMFLHNHLFCIHLHNYLG